MFQDTKAFSGFSANDMDAARKFYGETLGLRLEDQGDVLVLKIAGDRDTIIYPKENHEPATFTVLNFPAEDVPGTVAALKERGVEFERYEGTPAETDEDGVFRGDGPLIAWFKDPAGNVLAVIDANA